jgi:hypothetical protein
MLCRHGPPQAERDVAEVGLYENNRVPGKSQGFIQPRKKEKKEASAMDLCSSVPQDTPFLAFDIDAIMVDTCIGLPVAWGPLTVPGSNILRFHG